MAKRIRANPAWSGVRLVALSGFDQSADVERSLRAGFEAYRVKPADLSRLFSRLT